MLRLCSYCNIRYIYDDPVDPDDDDDNRDELRNMTSQKL